MSHNIWFISLWTITVVWYKMPEAFYFACFFFLIACVIKLYAKRIKCSNNNTLKLMSKESAKWLKYNKIPNKKNKQLSCILCNLYINYCTLKVLYRYLSFQLILKRDSNWLGPFSQSENFREVKPITKHCVLHFQVCLYDYGGFGKNICGWGGVSRFSKSLQTTESLIYHRLSIINHL